MHIIILLIFFCNNLRYSNTFSICCQENNIIVNGSCWDGSNVTSLSCEVRRLMGPTQDPPRILEIDDDDDLIITDEEEVGYYKVEPDKYCMTKEEENGTDLALVCVEKDEILDDPVLIVFYYLKCVCSFISVTFTLSVFIIYVFTPALQDIEGICIMNFVASLSVAFLIILLGPLLTLIDPYPCDTISFIFFTGTLATINWMSVLSFHSWRITIRPIFQTHMKWTVIYCCYGYGIPVLLVTTAIIVHHNQTTDLTTGESQCLAEMGNLLIFVYFYGPILIMILLSAILQLWVAKKVWMDIDRRDESQSAVRLRKKSLMYGHLVLVVGTTYILDTISYATMALDEYLDYFWHLSDCRTLLVGGVVFFIFVVLRNKVLKALSKKGLFCLKFPKKWEKLIDEESEHIETEEARLTRDSTGL